MLFIVITPFLLNIILPPKPTSLNAAVLFCYCFWTLQKWSHTNIFLKNIYLFIWLHRLRSCGMQTLSCGMHVGSSSQTRDRTRAPALGARSLNHCTTREVPTQISFMSKLLWLNVEFMSFIHIVACNCNLFFCIICIIFLCKVSLLSIGDRHLSFFSLGRLGKLLFWTSLYMFIDAHGHTFLLRTHLGAEMHIPAILVRSSQTPYSRRQGLQVPVVLHPHQHLLLSDLFISSILISVSWYHSAFFICRSLFIVEVKHLFHTLVSYLDILFSVLMPIFLPVVCLFLIDPYKYLMFSGNNLCWFGSSRKMSGQDPIDMQEIYWEKWPWGVKRKEQKEAGRVFYVMQTCPWEGEKGGRRMVSKKASFSPEPKLPDRGMEPWSLQQGPALVPPCAGASAPAGGGQWGSSWAGVTYAPWSQFSWRSSEPFVNCMCCKYIFHFYLFTLNFIYFFNVLAAPCGMWDLSSPTRYRTHAPCIGSSES